MIYKAVQATKGKETSIRIVAKAIADGRATDKDVLEYLTRAKALRQHLSAALAESPGLEVASDPADPVAELKQCAAQLTKLKAHINSIQKASGQEKTECARFFQGLTTRLRVCKMAHFRPPAELAPDGINDLFQQVQLKCRQTYDSLVANMKVCKGTADEHFCLH